MPTVVIKKDGTREDFIKEKIVTAAVKNGATKEIARNIADKIQKIDKNEIASSEIRDIIVHELKSVDPFLHERWINYERDVKHIIKQYKNKATQK